MKNLNWKAQILIISTILFGVLISIVYLSKLERLDIWLLILAGLTSITQIFKVEGATEKSSYNLSWVLYGFAFLLLGAPATLFIVLVSHIVEWIWHKYPWYIQSFNIATYGIVVFLAGLVYESICQGSKVQDLQGAIGMIVGLAVFVLLNHLLIGWVVKLARGQSIAESGVFEFFSLFLDFTILSMGAVTALIWFYNPFAAILNVLPLYLLYNAIRVPALKRQIAEMDSQKAQSGD